MNFSADEEPKTLADVAHSCAEAPGPRSPTHDKPHKSLAEAAMEYQEHLSPPKSQPAKVAVVTGEEEERNVLQVGFHSNNNNNNNIYCFSLHILTLKDIIKCAYHYTGNKTKTKLLLSSFGFPRFSYDRPKWMKSVTFGDFRLLQLFGRVVTFRNC